MSRASIGVTPSIKRALEAAKPEGMQWTEFFELLLHATDTGRFLSAAEAKQVSNEAEAIDRARARYTQYRSGATHAVTGAELRRRIHLRRLLESVETFRGSLRLAAENPRGMDAAALATALDDLDEQIHATRTVLPAA